jgi:hypothetical protein
MIEMSGIEWFVVVTVWCNSVLVTDYLPELKASD